MHEHRYEEPPSWIWELLDGIYFKCESWLHWIQGKRTLRGQYRLVPKKVDYRDLVVRLVFLFIIAEAITGIIFIVYG